MLKDSCSRPQRALWSELPFGSGSAALTVRGFVGLDVDLHSVGDVAITDCDGVFGLYNLDVDFGQAGRRVRECAKGAE